MSVLEKLRFGDGLVWTEGLTGEINLRFQISPAYCMVYAARVVHFLIQGG